MGDLIGHLEQYLGTISGGWTDPDEPETRFQVVQLDGASDSSLVSFSTLGLSRVPFHLDNDSRQIRHEFMITVQEDQVSSQIPALLHQIAIESIEGAEPLLRGQVVGPRGPLIPGSSMVAFYVAPPVHQPDAFSTYDTGEHVVVFVWLVPITHTEAHYVFDNGWSKFEDLLIQHSPDLSDFSRESICP